MDTNDSFGGREKVALHKGGTVEAASRTTPSQTPAGAPGERYELRDPFAEVTYRSERIAEITATADQLGSSQFIAIDGEGRRTTIQRIDGPSGSTWQRGPQRAARPALPLEALPVRAEVTDVTDKATPDGVARAPGQPSREQPRGSERASEQAGANSGSRPDGQAERAALIERLQAELQERYVVKRAPVTVGDLSIGRTEYRYRGDTAKVAFTESPFRLATDSNSPFVARSMVDVAETRNWKALRVTGHEEFRRRVWFEATLRGVKTIGYEPMPSDMAWLRSEREARLLNRIEPARDAAGNKAMGTGPADKGAARGSGGRKAVLVAIEAVLVANRVPEKKRDAIMAAATEKLAQRVREGQSPRVKVYDKAAPSQRPAVMPVPEAQRTRERAAPMR